MCAKIAPMAKKLILLTFLLIGASAWACGNITTEMWEITKRWARAYGLDPALLGAVVWVESRYCPQAVGRVGEVGLGQVRPKTAEWLGIPSGYLSHPEWNLVATARYLRYLYGRYGDWRKALAAYNAGPSRVDLGRIPPSTQIYVQNVLMTYDYMKRRYPR